MSSVALLDEWMMFTGVYNTNEATRLKIFNELIERYLEAGRYYHNLSHIERLLEDAREFYPNGVPAEVFFAIWFHDAVYNTILSNNNEVKSAKLAVERMHELGVPEEVISKTEALVLKTENHMAAEVKDEATGFFLDADLKTLGIAEDEFLSYGKAIRREFSLVPDLIFKSGRRKFIDKMLTAPRIYRTDKFYNLYEEQARKNLMTELSMLG
jgi:predicted metal-dependent HD superfamily phosphohydrolase